MVLGCTPTLVLMQGGDGLSICFNVISILFLLEIDNMAYMLGLGEKARGTVELHGRTFLDVSEAQALGHSKYVYIGLCTCVTVAMVWLGARVFMFLANLHRVFSLMLWSISIHDIHHRKGTRGEKAKQAGYCTASAVGFSLCYGAMVLMAYSV